MIESDPLTGSRHHYTYRADGMRVRKEIPGLVEKVYYDGQMPVETFEDFSSGNDRLTRNFVGARGIEMMETTQNSATTQVYPLYDTHGNMVATLSKNSAGTSWSLGNERSYDVWGSVRSGAVSGGPKGRYVANLGHVQDDESGLIYMRARYYEPESGRFVSEDRVKAGQNWYLYANNLPTSAADPTGNEAMQTAGVLGFGLYSLGLMLSLVAVANLGFDMATPMIIFQATVAASLIALGVSFYTAAFKTDAQGNTVVMVSGLALAALNTIYTAYVRYMISSMVVEANVAAKSHAKAAVMGLVRHNIVILGYIMALDLDAALE